MDYNEKIEPEVDGRSAFSIDKQIEYYKNKFKENFSDCIVEDRDDYKLVIKRDAIEVIMDIGVYYIESFGRVYHMPGDMDQLIDMVRNVIYNTK